MMPVGGFFLVYLFLMDFVHFLVQHNFFKKNFAKKKDLFLFLIFFFLVLSFIFYLLLSLLNRRSDYLGLP